MAEKKNLTVSVKNLSGEDAGTIELSASVFGVKKGNEQAVKDVVTVYLANRRQATAKTKKRHEIHGTNKKPYRQKGTGRARAGDVKSPIWVGGGTVFGPDGTQNYKLSQNKKTYALALKTVLSEKAKDGLIVVDDLKVKEVSTKSFATSLKALKAEGKTLLVAAGDNDKLILSARNIEGVSTCEPEEINVYSILNAEHLIVSKEDIKKIEEALK